MGKARLVQVRATQGVNKSNINPHSNDAYFEYERAQKIMSRYKHVQSRVNRSIRKYQKHFTKHEMNLYYKARRLWFGYWFYWLIEGKIGSEGENENEPNLLRSPVQFRLPRPKLPMPQSRTSLDKEIEEATDLTGEEPWLVNNDYVSSPQNT